MKAMKRWLAMAFAGVLAFAGTALGDGVSGTSGAVTVKSLGGYDVELHTEVKVGYPPFCLESGDEAGIWLDGAELFSSTGIASFDWQPQPLGSHVLAFQMNGTAVTSKTVNVATPCTYEISDGMAIVTGVNQVDEILVIPSSWNGFPVTGIRDRAFANCAGVTTVSIPNSVTNSGLNAFEGCVAVRAVFVPQYVCSGRLADVFPDAYATIETVTVIEGVTEIVDGAFEGCNSLTCLEFQGEFVDWGLRALPSAISDGLEPDASGLLIYQGWVLGHQNPEVSSISVPEGVVGIGSHAMADFWDLESVTFPETLRYIARGAFETNTYLDNLTIPGGVKRVGEGAFQGCTYIRDLTIGEGVEQIGAAAFANCTQLATVTVPESVKGIGDRAFSNCWRMLSVKLPLGLETAGRGIFARCSSLTGVTMPTHKYQVLRLFEDRYSALESVTVASGETNLCPYAFFGCFALSSVALPSSLERIGEGAFVHCGSLSEIELPGEALERVGREAFACSGLTAIVLPDSVRQLESRAFWHCRALQSASLSRSLETLPRYGFEGCSNLFTMVVPASVKTLGMGLGDHFQGLYFLGNAPAYDADAYTPRKRAITTYVVRGTRGWDGSPSSRDLPESWLGYPITYWEPNRFDAHFNANGGAFSDGAAVWSCEQITGTGYILPPQEPVLAGAEFDGWWTDPSEGARITATTRVNETREITFYAHWKGGGAPVTVRFNANGGTVTPAERTYSAGLPYGELPVPTRAHYRFEGWWTAQSGGSQIVAANRVPGADQALFAHWTAETYAIRFHANGGTGSMADQSFTYGSDVTLRANAFQRTDWEFAGWALAADGEAVYADRAAFADVSTVQDGVIHLYAVWIRGRYAVRFDANGGTGTMDNQTFTIEKEQALESCQFARAGFLFLGWARTSGGDALYEDGETVLDLTTVPGGTVVLYAKWGAEPLALAAGARNFTWAPVNSQELRVVATVEWTAQSSASWLTVLTASGSGNGSIVFDVGENPETETRTGTISVSGGGVTRTFTVTQDGRSVAAVLTLDASSRSCGVEAAGNLVLGVTANVDWTVESSAAWLTVRTAGGSGNGSIVFDVSANTGTWAPPYTPGTYNVSTNMGKGPRMATITVTGGGWTRTCTVMQKGAEDGWANVTLDGIVWYYTISDGNAEVTYVKDERETTTRWLASGNVVVPAFLGGIPVTSIGNYAFSPVNRYRANTGPFQVTFPDSVTNIGGHAFYDCGELTNVTLPRGLTIIGNDAFATCDSLTTVTIPDQVTDIGDSAFSGCYRLVSVAMPSNLTSMGWHVFSGCRSLAVLTIPQGVESIGAYAFYYCTNLTMATIPASVTNIGLSAFARCGIQTLYVPVSWKSKYVDGTFWSEYASVLDGCAIVYYGAFPDISDASEIAGALAGTADGRLAERIGSVEEYEAFRAWIDAKGLDGEAVKASAQAWPSYLLGAERLFEEEPVIRMVGVSAVEGTAGAWTVRVTVRDGEQAAAVDAGKVAELFQGSSRIGEWGAEASVPLTVESTGTEDGVLLFEVRPGAEGAGGAFLRVGE